MSGAPALPREVWAYTSIVPHSGVRYIFAGMSEKEVTSSHIRETAYYHERDTCPVSPIGRYVLADDERQRLRPQCSGEWIAGSGGHREHTHCDALATYWDDEDLYAYCDQHIKDHDREDYRNRHVRRRPTCPVCLAAHEPVPVCHECVRLKAKREAEEEIVAWLRSRNNDRQAMAIWAECADAIERGEHRKAER